MTVFIVPLLYAGIQMLELSAVLARISGLQSGNHLLGYSIQQSVYMGTRLLLVAMMPILGLLIDTGIKESTYQLITHSSLLIAAFFGFIVFFIRERIINYYIRVINRYKKNDRFIRSFFIELFKHSTHCKTSKKIQVLQLLRMPEARKIFIFSVVVFSIYSVGMFLSFYFALKFYDYRASISQLSGILNALGALLLTFVIEPIISKRIDEKHEHAEMLVMSLFLGRLIAIAFVGQLLLLMVYFGASR